jgi:hypothetical protein
MEKENYKYNGNTKKMEVVKDFNGDIISKKEQIEVSWITEKDDVQYFSDKLKETMGKDLPKKYLQTTDLGDIDKEYEHKFKGRIEKHLTDVDIIKNMIDNSKQ